MGDIACLNGCSSQFCCPIQLLQDHCSNGQSLLSSVLTSREKVIPWGVPQIEDRALDTAQREWGAYQGHLEETHSQLSSTLGRLKQMGQRFLILAQWLEEMEKAANVRQTRRSDKLTKDTQLKKLQVRITKLCHNLHVWRNISCTVFFFYQYRTKTLVCTVGQTET